MTQAVQSTFEVTVPKIFGYYDNVPNPVNAEVVLLQMVRFFFSPMLIMPLTNSLNSSLLFLRDRSRAPIYRLFTVSFPHYNNPRSIPTLVLYLYLSSAVALVSCLQKPSTSLIRHLRLAGTHRTDQSS